MQRIQRINSCSHASSLGNSNYPCLLFKINRGSSQLILYSSFYQDRREDTSLQLAHFRRHKRKTLKKTPGKMNANPFHVPSENNPPGKDSSNKIASVIGKAANIAGSARTKKVILCFIFCILSPVCQVCNLFFITAILIKFSTVEFNLLLLFSRTANT